MKFRRLPPPAQALRRGALQLAGMVALCLPLHGIAQESADVAVDAALLDQVRQLALHATQQAAPVQADEAIDPTQTATAPGKPLRFEVQVGSLDPRLKLAACQRIEPYLPPGTRLWGKARIGLRCAQGVRPWNVYLPITVRVFGQALVAAAPLPAGATLREEDLRLAEVDIAEDNAPLVNNATLAVGRVLTRPLIAGRGLRQTDLKPRMWFAAGDSVKVLASGPGFSVAGSGQALTPGIEGQTARVRTDSGQVLTGTPVGTRVVELSL
jgi:flagella basal body P-ring formation protein FlgA